MKRTILDFDVLDSTNNHLKSYHRDYPDHTFVRARYQTQGRGQFDRTWMSESDRNLLFSMLLKRVDVSGTDMVRSRLQGILLAFFHDYGVDAVYKEPNDLYVRSKKICGILIESQSSHAVYDVLIIGIGINVNQVDFQSINATSMAKITGKMFDLDVLFDDLSKRMDHLMPVK